MQASLIVLIPLGLLLLAGYFRLLRRWRNLRRDEQLVLSRARQKALHIIQMARDQALEIISAAKISANETDLKLKDGLEKISAEQLREFQKLLTNVSKTIEVDALKEMGAQIEREKQRRLEELDGQIKAVVADVVKQITGKVIPVAEHERIILQALEEAKKQHAL